MFGIHLQALCVPTCDYFPSPEYKHSLASLNSHLGMCKIRRVPVHIKSKCKTVTLSPVYGLYVHFEVVEVPFSWDGSTAPIDK
jgi:hypothetical protein